ncbi:MAG: hypothetical protein ACK4NO_08895 [Glycocaulis sp.]
MLSTFRYFGALAGGRVSLVSGHMKARALLYALLAVFLIGALVFACILGVLILADWLGTRGALAAIGGVFLFAAIATLIALIIEQRVHERRKQAARREEQRLMQAAMITALPLLKRTGVAGAALAGLALVLFLNRSGDDDED